MSFQKVFTFLAEHKEELEDYAIEQCSLEKIFLRLAKE